MENLGTPRWESEEWEEKKLPEGVTPSEANLASAEHLIERLEALDTLTRDDKVEAEKMIAELEKQRGYFIEEHLAVPETLPFAIHSLRELVMGAERSVREEYARKESEPSESTDLLAEAGKLELELIEQEASGHFHTQQQELKKKVENILPQLDALAQNANDEVKTLIAGQQSVLRKYLRAHSE